MPGKLTTHVLDTANGRPAEGIMIELWFGKRSSLEDRILLKTTQTNNDGRTDLPLLAGEEFKRGLYELVFTVGDYFNSTNPETDILFLNQIPIRFGIDNIEAHYHVPLLVSPWSYSTYRGS